LKRWEDSGQTNCKGRETLASEVAKDPPDYEEQLSKRRRGPIHSSEKKKAWGPFFKSRGGGELNGKSKTLRRNGACRLTKEGAPG